MAEGTLFTAKHRGVASPGKDLLGGKFDFQISFA